MKPPREPAFRAPSQAPMPLAEELSEDELDAATRPEDCGPRDWRPVDDDTPRDGAMIEVKPSLEAPDEQVIYAMWRVTRQRNAALKQWVVIGFWVNPFNRQRLDFDPEVWRAVEGFNMPGMVG